MHLLSICSWVAAPELVPVATVLLASALTAAPAAGDPNHAEVTTAHHHAQRFVHAARSLLDSLSVAEAAWVTTEAAGLGFTAGPAQFGALARAAPTRSVAAPPATSPAAAAPAPAAAGTIDLDQLARRLLGHMGTSIPGFPAASSSPLPFSPVPFPGLHTPPPSGGAVGAPAPAAAPAAGRYAPLAVLAPSPALADEDEAARSGSPATVRKAAGAAAPHMRHEAPTALRAFRIVDFTGDAPRGDSTSSSTNGVAGTG